MVTGRSGTNAATPDSAPQSRSLRGQASGMGLKRKIVPSEGGNPREGKGRLLVDIAVVRQHDVTVLPTRSCSSPPTSEASRSAGKCWLPVTSCKMRSLANSAAWLPIVAIKHLPGGAEAGKALHSPSLVADNAANRSGRLFMLTLQKYLLLLLCLHSKPYAWPSDPAVCG